VSIANELPKSQYESCTMFQRGNSWNGSDPSECTLYGGVWLSLYTMKAESEFLH
jgi:hypothetical protein